jgi:hypothetical protein
MGVFGIDTKVAQTAGFRSLVWTSGRPNSKRMKSETVAISVAYGEMAGVYWSFGSAN